MNYQLINNKGICRRALATLGLLNTENLLLPFSITLIAKVIFKHLSNPPLLCHSYTTSFRSRDVHHTAKITVTELLCYHLIQDA